MAEDQQLGTSETQKLGANEALCWSCGTVVVKHALVCPKCGQKYPGMSLAQKRVGSIVCAVFGITILIITIFMGGDTFGVLGMIIGIVVGATLAIIGILESRFYKKRILKTKIEG
jgi:predicted RNA-binding Zn-ribbon protein involved in translation (DUF1610 family)